MVFPNLLPNCILQLLIEQKQKQVLEIVRKRLSGTDVKSPLRKKHKAEEARKVFKGTC